MQVVRRSEFSLSYRKKYKNSKVINDLIINKLDNIFRYSNKGNHHIF